MPRKQKSPVYVLGVGMTKFTKPQAKVDYTELGFEAGVKALLDARINYDDVDQGVACYCYGDSACGQRVFYQFGMTQVPIYNVNSNCSSGGAGLALARDLVAGGAADCVMVVGFEKMSDGGGGGGGGGLPQSPWRDRESPLGTTVKMMAETSGGGLAGGSPVTAQMFGNAGREYMERYGATREDFAEIARVNHAHSAANPYAQLRRAYTLGEILAARTVFDPLTLPQCCPTSDGAAAAILVSREFLDGRPGGQREQLWDQAVEIAGMCLATDAPTLFSRSAIDLMGYAATQRAARAALAEAGVAAAREEGEGGEEGVQVVELHDCFSAGEMLALDALGLSGGEGRAPEMVRRGDVTYGGRLLVNPSGGLLSKGHPLGATGVAQCAELVWHLRGWAGNRAFSGRGSTRHCLQHNLGLGGAAVVAVYRRADGAAAPAPDSEAVARACGLGYNPAVEARGFTAEQVDAVRSRKARSEWALQDTQKKVEARF